MKFFSLLLSLCFLFSGFSAGAQNPDFNPQNLVVLRNENNLLPLRNLDKIRPVVLSIGERPDAIFSRRLNSYMPVPTFSLAPSADAAQCRRMAQSFAVADIVIVSIFSSEISADLSTFLEQLSGNKELIISYFGAKNVFTNNIKPASEILTGEDSDLLRDRAAQLIFGAFSASGKLSEKAGNYPAGSGLETENLQRFSYTFDEKNSSNLQTRLDSLVRVLIDSQAVPGCQILIAKNKQVVFRKTYGFHTYSHERATELNDIYDFASVTKITSALPALMRLRAEGKFDLDARLSDYLPYFKKSNKGDLTFRPMLSHYARLKAWIPFWSFGINEDGSFKPKTFSTKKSRKFPIELKEGLFLYKKYKQKTIYKMIAESELAKEKKYVYSDLPFCLLPEIVQKISGQDYETYLKNEIYRPLGAYSLVYNPYKHFPLSRIVPTENDTFFRKFLIQGRVHDEGAAVLGGISGNAGLFGTADDLAKLMQAYSDGGTYGGRRIIPEKAVKEFNSRHFAADSIRRGLGFDKPLVFPGDSHYISEQAPDESFGHTGYTGIFTWADPVNDLLIVFMSNRVHPTRDNRKIYALRAYANLQKIAYEELVKNTK